MYRIVFEQSDIVGECKVVDFVVSRTSVFLIALAGKPGMLTGRIKHETPRQICQACHNVVR